MMMTAEKFMALVHEIDDEGKGLTPWEIEFIAGFIDRSRPLEDGDVTEKMCKTLRRIRDERLR